MQTSKILTTAGFLGVLTLGLSACADRDRGPDRVREDQPSFTYTFDGSEEELQEARFDAEAECRERYGRDADLVETYDDGDEVVAIFECD